MVQSILFILKRREIYNEKSPNNLTLSSGLYNSAKYVSDMLVENQYISNISVVPDSNSIEQEIVKHRATIVIVEALWVTPEKIAQLQKLYPKIHWVIRIHSEVPFLAGEGIALKWIGEYCHIPNVIIGVNSPRMEQSLEIVLKTILHNHNVEDKIVYLPNYYPVYDFSCKDFDKNKDHIDIACFGAIRPLKNHLAQAIAALNFANIIGKKLHFHINGNRIEQKGDSTMKNLSEMFKHLNSIGHKLVCHDWLPRSEFLVLCATMDMGMQISLSETFNIVSADFISCNIPIIVTHKEIPWASRMFSAKATDHRSMVDALCLSYTFPKINTFLNKRGLKKYVRTSAYIWKDYIDNQE